MADDGYIVQPIAIDEGAVIVEKGALPAGLDHGKVVRWLRVETESCPLGQFEADVAHEMNRPTEMIKSFRYEDAGPT